MPQWSKVVLASGIECIACGRAPDGRRYLVPHWSTLDERAHALAGEKRPIPILKKIDQQYQGHLLRIRSGVAEWWGACPGETFFIVGSGPSLLRNGHLLRKRPGTKVIAINAALRYLVKRGTPPDFWFALDWKGSKGWLEGVDTAGVSLITSVTTPPKIVDRFDRYYHFVGLTKSPDCREGVNEKLAYLGGLDAGLTATYSAMYFAWAAGAKRIVLVGQDFAYSFGMYHWDQPTPRGCYENQKAFPWPDIAGCDTVTDRNMSNNCAMVLGAAMWLEEDGVEVVNASQHGILDWNCQPLESVVEAIEAPIQEPVHEHV